MSESSLKTVIDQFRPSELFGLDFGVGLLGGAGGVWLALAYPEGLANGASMAATLVGIIIGAVVAGVAVTAAFLDATFLRKLRTIGREPVRYVAPFLLTVFLGVVAALVLLVLGVLPPTTVPAVLATLAGLAGFTTVWALCSVVPAVGVLIQFLGLQFDASEVADIDPGTPRLVEEDPTDSPRHG
jgi:hypothetical protein